MLEGLNTLNGNCMLYTQVTIVVLGTKCLLII
jgi:hypothetical protein